MASDYFIMDSQAHIAPKAPRGLAELAYFPGVKRFRDSGESVIRVITGKIVHMGDWTYESLIKDMDAGGVDMACILPEKFMSASGWSAPFSTNGYLLEAAEKYPDRLLIQPNVGPILKRGVKDAIWELEYMVKEKGAKMAQLYSPEDTYINDERLWPFYEKCQELGVVLTCHTGLGWAYPDKTKYCNPVQLDDVCNEFYDLRIVAFNFGWPFHHELNTMAIKYPNLYINMGFLLQNYVPSPRRFQELLGEAIQFAGVEKIIWGVDWPCATMKDSVAILREVQIPEDLQKWYGFKPITNDDRRKMFGENLAKLLGIEPRKRALTPK